MLTFKSPAGQFWCSLQDWGQVAKLARDGGWKPQGIPQPIDEAGSGLEPGPDLWDYSRPGIVISVPDDDAKALADALESALPDLPRFDALEEKAISRLDLPGRVPIRVLRPGVQVNPYEYFSGINRQALERFIAIVRAGNVTVR